MTASANDPGARSAIHRRLWREGLTAARFAAVGLAATAVHILVVAVLLSETALPALTANTLAFLMAFGISFSGNYLWTFQAPGEPRKAIKRFLLISISAFALNTLILATVVRAGLTAPLYAAIGSAAIVPLITYLASRFWGFRNLKRA